jgi:thiosulfate/3-mercaptopyruvate sulfurtransferase
VACAWTALRPYSSVINMLFRNMLFRQILWRNSRKTGAVSSAPPKGPASFFAVWRRPSAPFALWTIALICLMLEPAAFCASLSSGDEPWTAKDLITPANFAATLAHAERSKPTVIFAGFPVLYRAAHIPGAILAGPVSKLQGLQQLKTVAHNLPHGQDIVLYCGCCPFSQCPNIRPTFRAMREMGFTHVRVLVLDTNLHTDWVAKGYPVMKGGKE